MFKFKKMDIMMKRSLSLMLSTSLLAGCSLKIGPQNLRTDALQYNHAVQSTNDSQLLLNIVRMRYRDTPSFLQIGIISSNYEFKKLVAGEFRDADDIFRIGAELTEKPTITMQPTRGESYVKEFMAPISFETILLLNSSGWGMDRILRCCVQRLNDLKNAPTASGPTPAYVPEYKKFRELADLFHELEKKDGVDIVVIKNPKTDKREIVFELDPEVATQAQLNRIWQLLDVDPGTMHIKFVPYHGQDRARNEVMVQSRSPISVLYFLSQGVNVPYNDEYRGVVTVTVDEFGNGFSWTEVLGGIINIQSTELNQRCCVNRRICVGYRCAEFYIDDRDLDSKSTFSMVSQLMALQFGCVAIPALTLPINQ